MWHLRSLGSFYSNRVSAVHRVQNTCGIYVVLDLLFKQGIWSTPSTDDMCHLRSLGSFYSNRVSAVLESANDVWHLRSLGSFYSSGTILCTSVTIGPCPNSLSPTSTNLYNHNCYDHNCFPIATTTTATATPGATATAIATTTTTTIITTTTTTTTTTLIARFIGPTWGPCGADRTQVGPMLAAWTLLFGYSWHICIALMFVCWPKHYMMFIMD